MEAADAASIGRWGVPLAVRGGAIRISTTFRLVSLGECVTAKWGRVNIVLESTVGMGAMSGYGISYLTGSGWLGVFAASAVGAVLGALHSYLCGGPRVNAIAVGIAMML